MVYAIRSSVVLAVALVMSPSIVHGQRPSSNANAPTPMEQALMEHACRVPGQARSAADAYDECLAAELARLRTDFGRDLQRVAAKDRRRIDARCAELRTMRGRDAYIACLSDELRAIQSKGTSTLPAAASRGAAADAVESGPAVVSLDASVAAGTTQAAPSAGSSRAVWFAAAAFLLGVGGGGWWFLSHRARLPVRRQCRACGADTDDHGELCGQCRHEAALAQRRAVAEQSEREQALADEARRAREAAEAQATQASETEQARQALEREAERTRLEEAARQREEETRRWQQAAAAALVPQADDQATDPYAVLGLEPTATEVEIHFAYLEAIAKYAPGEVAHLGEELRNLYQAKAKIVQQAYETLTTPARAH